MEIERHGRSAHSDADRDRQEREGRRAAHPVVTQKSEYDIDFLWRRARIRGYVVEIQKYEGTNKEFLYFGPSTAKAPDPLSTYVGHGLSDLKITLTTANQVKKVTVHGWDREKQKPIERAPWTGPIRS